MTLFRNLPYTKENLIHLFAASLLINVLGLVMPITLMQIYDRIIPYDATSTLFWLILGCCIALALEAILRISRFFISIWISTQYGFILDTTLVEKMLLSDLKGYESEGYGVHSERLNSIGVLRGFYAGPLLQVLFDLPFAICFICLVMYLAFWLAFVPITLIVLYLSFVLYVRSRYAKAQYIQDKISERRFGYILQVLTGIITYKSFGMEEQLMRRYESLQTTDTKVRMGTNFWNVISNDVGQTLTLFNIFMIIFFGSFLVINGSITTGTLSACMILGSRTIAPVQAVAGLILSLVKVDLAREDIKAIEAMKPEVEPGTIKFPRDFEGSLELRGISFTYGEGLADILKDVDLKVEKNQMVGITSTGSAGTTTFLYLMMGILKPTAGTVYIGNNNLAKWDHTDIHHRIGYLPPKGAIFDGTILENLTMFNKEHVVTAFDTASLLGLDELVAHLPNGYETVVDHSRSDLLPSNLVQRISIARALIVRPRILLIDKIDEAIDVNSDKVLTWLLEKLKGNCTIVIVTRKKKYLSMTDVVYELKGSSLHKSDISYEEEFDAILPFKIAALGGTAQRVVKREVPLTFATEPSKTAPAPKPPVAPTATPPKAAPVAKPAATPAAKVSPSVVPPSHPSAAPMAKTPPAAAPAPKPAPTPATTVPPVVAQAEKTAAASTTTAQPTAAPVPKAPVAPAATMVPAVLAKPEVDTNLELENNFKGIKKSLTRAIKKEQDDDKQENLEALFDELTNLKKMVEKKVKPSDSMVEKLLTNIKNISPSIREGSNLHAQLKGFVESLPYEMQLLSKAIDHVASLNVSNTYGCPPLLLDASISDNRIINALDELARTKGLPKVIRISGESEFISKAMLEWAYRRGVQLDFTSPRTPTDNAFIESSKEDFENKSLNQASQLRLDKPKKGIDWDTL